MRNPRKWADWFEKLANIEPIPAYIKSHADLSIYSFLKTVQRHPDDVLSMTGAYPFLFYSPVLIEDRTVPMLSVGGEKPEDDAQLKGRAVEIAREMGMGLLLVVGSQDAIVSNGTVAYGDQSGQST